MTGINVDSVPLDVIYSPIDSLIDSRVKVSLKSLVAFLENVAGGVPHDVVQRLESRRFECGSDLGIDGFLRSCIVEASGVINLRIPKLSFGVTFLAGRKPKTYMAQYVEFARQAKARLIIWIDDVIAAIKYRRSPEEQRIVNNLYQEALRHHADEIIFSSDYFTEQTIPSWLLRKATTDIFWEEFLELLPYHQRDTAYISLFDLVHFLWFATIYSQLNTDYILTAINTYYHFKLTQKVTGIKRNVIFLRKQEITDRTYGGF